jgi:hypothetical protein
MSNHEVWGKLVAQASVAMDVRGPKLSSAALINNVIGFLINRENSLIGFTEVIPANKIKKGYQEPFKKKQFYQVIISTKVKLSRKDISSSQRRLRSQSPPL